MLYLLLAVLSSAFGITFGYWLRKQKALSEINSSEAKADKIITDAKSKETQILLDAQAKSLQVLADTKKEIDLSKSELAQTREKLEQREKCILLVNINCPMENKFKYLNMPNSTSLGSPLLGVPL